MRYQRPKGSKEYFYCHQVYRQLLWIDYYLLLSVWQSRSPKLSERESSWKRPFSGWDSEPGPLSSWLIRAIAPMSWVVLQLFWDGTKVYMVMVKNGHSLWLFLHCCSVAMSSRVWLCTSIDCSTPGSSILNHLPEFSQIHVHWVSDAT